MPEDERRAPEGAENFKAPETGGQEDRFNEEQREILQSIEQQIESQVDSKEQQNFSDLIRLFKSFGDPEKTKDFYELMKDKLDKTNESN